MLPTLFGFRANFVARIQIEYRTLYMHRVPRIYLLQFLLSVDRTAAAQRLLSSMCDALSGIFNVADSMGTIILDSPA